MKTVQVHLIIWKTLVVYLKFQSIFANEVFS